MATTRIIIELEIDGDASDAHEVVDRVLDAGHLQDAINDHDHDCGPLRVVSAVIGDDHRDCDFPCGIVGCDPKARRECQ